MFCVAAAMVLAGCDCTRCFYHVRRSMAFHARLLVYRYEMIAGAPFCDIPVCCRGSFVNCIQNMFSGDV